MPARSGCDVMTDVASGAGNAAVRQLVPHYDQVSIVDRWDRFAGGTAPDANVAICGRVGRDRDQLVQRLVREEVAAGAKVIVFDNGGRYQRFGAGLSAELVHGSTLEAFIDPAEVMEGALRDCDVLVVDLAPTMVSEDVSWPPLENAAALLRLLLDAQRIRTVGRLVIFIDDASLLFEHESVSEWTSVCLERGGARNLSHVLVCESSNDLCDGADRDAMVLISTSVLMSGDSVEVLVESQ